MKRDPRMVERKKPGLAKARKRVSPLVSLTHFLDRSPPFSVRLGQTLTFDLPRIAIFPLPIAVLVICKIIVPRCTLCARRSGDITCR
jgi:hypothetical protein